MAADSATPVDLRRVVPALGVAQIISWGTLFYSIAVLGAPMRDDDGRCVRSRDANENPAA